MTRLSSFVTHVRKLFQIIHLSSQWYTYNRITLDDLLPVWVDATRANLLSFLLSSAKYFKGDDKEDHELEEGDHQARKGNQNQPKTHFGKLGVVFFALGYLRIVDHGETDECPNTDAAPLCEEGDATYQSVEEEAISRGCFQDHQLYSNANELDNVQAQVNCKPCRQWRSREAETSDIILLETVFVFFIRCSKSKTEQNYEYQVEDELLVDFVSSIRYFAL